MHALVDQRRIAADGGRRTPAATRVTDAVTADLAPRPRMPAGSSSRLSAEVSGSFVPRAPDEVRGPQLERRADDDDVAEDVRAAQPLDRRAVIAQRRRRGGHGPRRHPAGRSARSPPCRRRRSAPPAPAADSAGRQRGPHDRCRCRPKPAPCMPAHSLALGLPRDHADTTGGSGDARAAAFADFGSTTRGNEAKRSRQAMSGRRRAGGCRMRDSRTPPARADSPEIASTTAPSDSALEPSITHRRRRRRQRRQLEGRADDRRQRSERSADQLRQIVAGHVLHDLSAGLRKRAVGRRELDADHEIARRAEPLAPRAAVVGREQPADRRAIRPRRIERQPLPRARRAAAFNSSQAGFRPRPSP